MKRPDKIKVLGKTYRVRVVEHSQDLEADDYGMCDNDKHVIYLVAGRSLGNDQDTLLHEIIHAVEFQMGVDGSINKKPSDEARVQGLAVGLLAVLKDNAGLVSYLRQRT